MNLLLTWMILVYLFQFFPNCSENILYSEGDVLYTQLHLPKSKQPGRQQPSVLSQPIQALPTPDGPVRHSGLAYWTLQCNLPPLQANPAHQPPCQPASQHPAQALTHQPTNQAASVTGYRSWWKVVCVCACVPSGRLTLKGSSPRAHCQRHIIMFWPGNKLDYFLFLYVIHHWSFHPQKNTTQLLTYSIAAAFLLYIPSQALVLFVDVVQPDGQQGTFKQHTKLSLMKKTLVALDVQQLRSKIKWGIGSMKETHILMSFWVTGGRRETDNHSVSSHDTT